MKLDPLRKKVVDYSLYLSMETDPSGLRVCDVSRRSDGLSSLHSKLCSPGLVLRPVLFPVNTHSLVSSSSPKACVLFISQRPFMLTGNPPVLSCFPDGPFLFLSPQTSTIPFPISVQMTSFPISLSKQKLSGETSVASAASISICILLLFFPSGHRVQL